MCGCVHACLLYFLCLCTHVCLYEWFIHNLNIADYCSASLNPFTAISLKKWPPIHNLNIADYCSASFNPFTAISLGKWPPIKVSNLKSSLSVFPPSHGSKCTVLKVIGLSTILLPVCMCAHFSPEILQAGAVKGLRRNILKDWMRPTGVCVCVCVQAHFPVCAYLRGCMIHA